MELEKQVCSLELAKRLKELGVKQESYCYWCDGKLKATFLAFRKDKPEECFFSAFTVAELGDMLPLEVRGGLIETGKRTIDGGYGWFVCYEGAEDGPLIQGYRDTEADARAKMLIYLLENNLVKPNKEG